MGKHRLTDRQRKFLHEALELYKEYPTVTFPRIRVENVLKNGCYYDDRSSRVDPPLPIVGTNRRSDKLMLNTIGETLKTYYAYHKKNNN